MSQFCRSHGANQQSTKHAEEDTRGDLQCHAVHPETEVPGKKKQSPEVKETNSMVGTCMEKNRRARKTECQLLLQLYTSTKRPRADETKRKLYDCIKPQKKTNKTLLIYLFKHQTTARVQDVIRIYGTPEDLDGERRFSNNEGIICICYIFVPPLKMPDETLDQVDLLYQDKKE